jgi:sporulation protein YlmC with PRC-barrel domain
VTAARTGDRLPSKPIMVARDIVGAEVVDAGGKGLGRVVDIDIDVAAGFLVTALEIGHPQLVARLRLLRPLSQARAGHRPRTVAWRDVDRIERSRIMLKPGARIGGHDPDADDGSPEGHGEHEEGDNG